MAAPTITNGEEHFFPIIYEGNGAGRRVGRFVPFTDDGTITNSLIFNKGDSPRLNRTPSGTGTSRRKYTLSVWAKPSLSSSASDERYIIAAGPYGNSDAITFDDDRTLKYWINGRTDGDFKTNRTFEDSSKFYHILVSVDTTQSTASDRVKIYVDGDQITSFSLETYPSQNYDGNWGSTASTNIGSSDSPNRYYNGYLAEVNYVDGTALTPSTFGLTNTSTGRWIPKTLSGITYGTNGFRLTFADSSALGDDTSGNGNDFTATNLASTDQTTDSPSQNFPTFDSNQTIDNAGGTNIFSEGNLRVDMDYGGSGNQYGMALMNPAYAVTSGKYYWEHKLISQSHTNPSIYNLSMPGIIDLNVDKDITSYIGHTSGPTTYSWYTLGGYVFCDGTYDTQQYLPGGSTLPAIGDIINFALDMDNGAWYIGVNGTYVTANGAVGDPTSGSARTGAVRTFAPNTRKYIYGTSTQSGFNCVDEVNFGQKSFTHSIPTGYTKWQQDNVPTTDKGVSGFTWIKNRDSGSLNHALFDSSRGPLKYLNSNTDGAEGTEADTLTKFLKGGFATEDGLFINTSGDRFVSWNWVANGATTSANGDGSITTTTQVNSTAGFSIIQYTGTEAAATIGHGLSQTPDFIMIKSLESHSPDGYWIVWHKSFAANQLIYLNLNLAIDTSTNMFNNTLPTSSVINLGDNFNTNMSGDKMICYAWHEVDGFSKFGSYTGNNSTDGPFIYTGFSPAFIMVKKTNASADWAMQDTARYSINPNDRVLQPNLTDAEVTGFLEIDFLSNGFKFRSADNQHNASGGSYIYFAFAEHPFVGDGTSPVTAR